ncbi:serine/threonine-protein kinase PCRK1 [Selaginella moellendorffii]|nr:serine/threonine-protein kinase PCRK1 [Selaginella moellendorffii]|eukprot:XP_002974621.2 serine/threonine-protein kinase PCRK1 [Selaginella moellendorffii]
MGCFQVHQSDGERRKRKRRRILWWSFSFVFSRNSGRSSSSGGSSDSSGELNCQRLQELRQFTLAELKSATRNFSAAEKLGEGGFGCVFRGHIKSKKTDERIDVAVKQLNVKGQQGQKEWLNEVTYLRMVDHPNLVKLLGYCLEHDDRGPQCLLVYELMPNKSLDDHIFQSRRPVIPWGQRLQIALGTARGLAYLHEEMKPPIIYRDLKSANILLDNEFRPKLSDFGLARDGPVMGNTHVTTAVVGTAGYAAPEYVQTGHINAKSDVWTFGMVLLELLTGRRALDMNRPRSERSLADWVKPYSSDSKKFRKIIDPRLKTNFSSNEARTLLWVAQKCIAKNPKLRPKMSEVVKQLEGILVVTAPVEKPAEVPEGAKSRNQSIASMADIIETDASRTDLSGEYNLAEVARISSVGTSKSMESGTGSGALDGSSKEVSGVQEGTEICSNEKTQNENAVALGRADGDSATGFDTTNAEVRGPPNQAAVDHVAVVDESDTKENQEPDKERRDPETDISSVEAASSGKDVAVDDVKVDGSEKHEAFRCYIPVETTLGEDADVAVAPRLKLDSTEATSDEDVTESNQEDRPVEETEHHVPEHNTTDARKSCQEAPEDNHAPEHNTAEAEDSKSRHEEATEDNHAPEHNTTEAEDSKSRYEEATEDQHATVDKSDDDLSSTRLAENNAPGDVETAKSPRDEALGEVPSLQESQQRQS